MEGHSFFLVPNPELSPKNLRGYAVWPRSGALTGPSGHKRRALGSNGWFHWAGVSALGFVPLEPTKPLGKARFVTAPSPVQDPSPFSGR